MESSLPYLTLQQVVIGYFSRVMDLFELEIFLKISFYTSSVEAGYVLQTNVVKNVGVE